MCFHSCSLFWLVGCVFHTNYTWAFFMCKSTVFDKNSISTKLKATWYFNAFSCGIWLWSFRWRDIFTWRNVLNNFAFEFHFRFCTVKEKFYGQILATTFFHLVTEKTVSVASWRLLKKVNFRPCMKPHTGSEVNLLNSYLSIKREMVGSMHVSESTMCMGIQW